MTTLKRNNKGFTLVEVLISIVMVGILFLPLLSVFSKSMNANNVSKNIQRANSVASTVAEQVRSYDTFADMCNIGSTSGNDLVLTASNAGVYSFKLSNLENDGVDYTADIKVDYTKYNNLNAKGLPQITSLGAGSTVMAYEQLNSTDTVIAAYQAKYLNDSGGSNISSDEVAKALKKTVKIEVTDTKLDSSGVNMLSAGTVHVYVYTEYTIDASRTNDDRLKGYASDAVRTDVLYDENVVLEKLKGIYIFFSYDIAGSIDIFQGIDFSMTLQQNYSEECLNNLVIYSLCQGIDDVIQAAGAVTGDDMYTRAETMGYKTVISRSGSLPSGVVKDYVSIFSNFPAIVDGNPQSRNKMDDIVSSVAIERLAKVSITVYKDGEECATMETTRGE